jgi:hypothetical protein
MNIPVAAMNIPFAGKLAKWLLEELVPRFHCITFGAIMRPKKRS